MFQNVYKWNRNSRCRYDATTAVKLDYMCHLNSPYVKLNYTKETLNWAVQYGKGDVIKWLHKNLHMRLSYPMIDKLLLDKNIDIKWLCKNHVKEMYNVLEYHNIEDIEIFKCIHSNLKRCKLSRRRITSILKRLDKNNLNWLYINCKRCRAVIDEEV